MELVKVKRMLSDRANDREAACFISYARGEPEDQHWVVELASDLRNAAVRVRLDEWDNAEPGRSIARFIEQIPESDYIIVVGTPLYKQKASNEFDPSGSIAAAEVDAIYVRLTQSEADKQTVLPLLRRGQPRDSFPGLLAGRTFTDFRDDDNYFAQVLKVILTLHRFDFRDPKIATLNTELSAAMVSAGVLSVV